LAAAAYVPRYRLDAATFASVWGGRASGERAVANHDEDSLTMAVEAGSLALGQAQGTAIDGLIFASTTAPYAEKQNATLAATVLDLRPSAFTLDVAGSLRAGTSAVRLAADAVRAGSARTVLVTASDMRLAEPGSDLELTLGDASAALLIGEGDAIATIVGTYSLSYEFTDIWRRRHDKYLKQADARFAQLYGYERTMRDLAAGLREKYNLRPEDVDKVVHYGPDLRTHRGLTQVLGFRPESYQDGALLTQVGNSGTAQVFLGLIQALEEAKPGERIAVLGYGSGGDALLLEVTDAVEEWQPRSCLRTHLANKRPLGNYGKYLRFRDLIDQEHLSPYTSPILLWRELKADLQLYGLRCLACGAVQYPWRRICWKCGAKDNFTEMKLARRGTVVTFTKDTLVPSPDPPTTMVTVDLEGGGRIYCQLTDTDASAVQVGMTVEATFRKYHEGEDFNNYFWKFRAPLQSR
jgi:3-hydroxy-3-methylglutaryl CoA synthase